MKGSYTEFARGLKDVNDFKERVFNRISSVEESVLELQGTKATGIGGSDLTEVEKELERQGNAILRLTTVSDSL